MKGWPRRILALLIGFAELWPLNLVVGEPGSLAFGEGLSPAVAAAADEIAATFIDYWRKLSTVCSAMASGEASVVNT